MLIYCHQSPTELNEVDACDAVRKPVKEWVSDSNLSLSGLICINDPFIRPVYEFYDMWTDVKDSLIQGHMFWSFHLRDRQIVFDGNNVMMDTRN
jgi:hypothetical protein